MDFQPQNTLGFLMRQAFWSMKNRIHQKLRAKGTDITMEQGGVLMRLWMEDGQSQGALAHFLGKDKTTLARLMSNMEKHSLIVRVPSKEDKRINHVYLTEKGKQYQRMVKESIIETLGEASVDITEEELKVTTKVLKQIFKNLGGDKTKEEVIC